MRIEDLRSSLKRDNSAPKRAIEDIGLIVVHHDAVEITETYSPLNRYISQALNHYERDWNEDERRDGSGLMYHYKIDTEGVIYYTRGLENALWHCGDYQKNLKSIAICLDGNFQKQKPTIKQLNSLKEFLIGLCIQHPEFPADFDDVFGHREISATACPGENLIKFVQAFREKAGNVNQYTFPYINNEQTTQESAKEKEKEDKPETEEEKPVGEKEQEPEKDQVKVENPLKGKIKVSRKLKIIVITALGVLFLGNETLNLGIKSQQLISVATSLLVLFGLDEFIGVFKKDE